MNSKNLFFSLLVLLISFSFTAYAADANADAPKNNTKLQQNSTLHTRVNSVNRGHWQKGKYIQPKATTAPVPIKNSQPEPPATKQK